MTPTTDTVGAFVGGWQVLDDGGGHGPLAGLDLAVKDLFDVAGTVTGAGNPSFASARAPASRHAPAVQRLVAAGTRIVGKTITDELAYSLSGTNVHYGTPSNPAAPGRVPGGSSAGSASAVAAGLADIALGTDTGGSIRVPASYCGIAGWRPTHGSVPLEGVVPLSPSFDTVGLFARDAERLHRAATVLLGDGTVGRRVRRLRLVAEVQSDAAPSVAEATARIARVLGTDPIPVELDVDLSAAVDAFRTRQGWEAWRAHGEWITRVAPSMGPGIAARFAAASAITLDEVATADDVRAGVTAAVAKATADGTVLVVPAAAGAAPPLVTDAATHEAQRARTLRLTCLAGLAGAPVVVLPLASDGGLPLGVAFIGAPGSDAALLDWARGIGS